MLRFFLLHLGAVTCQILMILPLSSVLPLLSCRALCSFSQAGSLLGAQRQGYPAGLYQGGLGSQLNLEDRVISGPACWKLHLACVCPSLMLQMVASVLEEVTGLLNHSCFFVSLMDLPSWHDIGLE